MSETGWPDASAGTGMTASQVSHGPLTDRQFMVTWTNGVCLWSVCLWYSRTLSITIKYRYRAKNGPIGTKLGR